MYYNLAK